MDNRRCVDFCRLNLDVAYGRAEGKIIWQPRIGCWLYDKQWAGESLGRYEGMSLNDIYRSLGCSDRPYNAYNPCYRPVEPSSVVRKSEQLSDIHTLHIIDTPVGSVTYGYRTTTSSYATIVEKHWIETPDDMKVFTWLMDNSGWEWDQELYERGLAECGDLGAPQIFMPRVNVQDLYINTMGVEKGVYAIYEWESVVKDYFCALHENHMRMISVINESPIQLINFGDNIHCATLSPSLYEEYVLPAYLERCDKLHSAGKFVFSHWDGDVRALLKFAKISGLDGIEAITPKPQGDVTLEEVKDALGDEIFLIDGIPAILFDETFSEGELIECTHKVINLFAPKLILGISDELSSTGDIERIRTVGKIVDEYNEGIGNRQ